ncbi:hypothetical protein K8I28_13375 [bacterium]|nr:hypothetical protein [bacterium]
MPVSGWRGPYDVPGSIGPSSPFGTSFTLRDIPAITDPIKKRLGIFPSTFIWDNDTTRNFGAMAFYANLFQSVPLDYCWGDLREYIFWKITSTKGDLSFFSPVTLGDRDTVVVLHSNDKLIGYHFSFLIDSLSIPQTDTTAFEVSLILFDKRDTTGTVLDTMINFTVARFKIESALDSLVWFDMTHPHNSDGLNFSISSKLVESLPTSQHAWSLHQGSSAQIKNRSAFHRCLEQSVYLIENKIDSTPISSYYNNPKKWARSQNSKLVSIKSWAYGYYSNPLNWKSPTQKIHDKVE